MSDPSSTPPPYLPPAPPPGAGPVPAPPSYGGTFVPGAPPPSPYGAAPPSFGGMPAGPSGSGRSGKAIAALVLGLCSIVLFVTILVPVLAVVFGLLGAKEVKRSAGTRRGLGMARAGWILGALGLLGAAAFWVFVGTEIAGTVDVRDLEVGDCVDLPDDGDQTVLRVEQHDCTEAHIAEVFSVGDLGDGSEPYPGQSRIDELIAERCLPDFEEYVGIAYDASELLVFQIYPGEANWKTDQEYVCLAFLEDREPLTESVHGWER